MIRQISRFPRTSSKVISLCARGSAPSFEVVGAHRERSPARKRDGVRFELPNNEFRAAPALWQVVYVCTYVFSAGPEIVRLSRMGRSHYVALGPQSSKDS